MAAADVKAIQDRIIQKLDGQKELDLSEFGNLLRHLLFDVSDGTIRAIFDEIDIEDVGTIESSILLQDNALAKRVLKVLDDSNAKNKKLDNGEDVLDGSEFKMESPRSILSDNTNNNYLSDHNNNNNNNNNNHNSQSNDNNEKDEMIEALQNELELLKSWKLEYGDSAIIENKELREQIKVYQSDESELASKMDEMKLKLEEKTNEFNNLKNEFVLLKSENGQLSNECEKITLNLNDKCQEYDKLINEMENFRFELMNVKERNEELTKINNEFEKQNELMKIQVSKAIQEKNEAMLGERQLTSEFENVNEMDTQKILDLENEIKKLKEELQEASVKLSNNQSVKGNTAPASASARNMTIRWDMGQKTIRNVTQRNSGNKLTLNLLNADSNTSRDGNNSFIPSFNPNMKNDLSSLLDDDEDDAAGNNNGVDPFEEQIRREIESELNEKFEIEFEKRLNDAINEEKQFMEEDFKENILPNMRKEISMEMKQQLQQEITTMMQQQISQIQKNQHSVTKKTQSIIKGYDKRLKKLKSNVGKLKENEQAKQRKKKKHKATDESDSESEGDAKSSNRQKRGKYKNLDSLPQTKTCVLFGWPAF